MMMMIETFPFFFIFFFLLSKSMARKAFTAPKKITQCGALIKSKRQAPRKILFVGDDRKHLIFINLFHSQRRARRAAHKLLTE